ncbi:hypothetical protein [Pseudonocardia sp. NPDC049154]|uniref:hypothetical protein n=1 Tax=Pseudonocardia sp. NPDC049154 TaxID=3155501 RepID=UPI0033C18179
MEDDRLPTGRGIYVDDVVVPDMLHAVFVRSVVPHAWIVGIDTAAAEALPGVHAVLTGAQVVARTTPFVGAGRARRRRTRGDAAPQRARSGPGAAAALDGLREPHYPCMATDVVRLVGDPVAIVLATRAGRRGRRRSTGRRRRPPTC